jgi:hypothetical protein
MGSLRDVLNLKVGDKDDKNVETVEEANKAKEGYYITHQSTWMLVKAPKVKEMNQLVHSLPIRLKVRLFAEDEIEIITYNNQKISTIQSQIADFASAQISSLNMKVVLENKIMKFDGNGNLKDL